MSDTKLYTIDSRDINYLESVWAFAQARDLSMYKTRLTRTYVAWVIELPANSTIETRYLLEFSQHTTLITGVYYTA